MLASCLGISPLRALSLSLDLPTARLGALASTARKKACGQGGGLAPSLDPHELFFHAAVALFAFLHRLVFPLPHFLPRGGPFFFPLSPSFFGP